MGNLPADRLRALRPFNICGVDFCGPFSRTYRIRGKPPYKSYVALFVCFASKAVHLELVSDLTTDAFLLAFQRFVSRRGIPEKVWCDNATNFVGADRHMREFRARLEEQGGGIETFASKKGCEFAFIPPRALHFGGLWEAGVKSAKHLFLRTVGQDLLTAEELGTLLTSVEAVLNSRPLGALSSDPNDGEALTPGHLLIGGPLLAPPSAALPDQISLTCLRRWRGVSSLRQRSKWHQGERNLVVGALVVVAEDNLPPQQWRIGRVVAVHAGVDSKVRVADVRTQDGEYRRAVHRLALLPVLL
ncbi:uncharacterized protein LOC128264149 [Drosophila gunungcola]|uniref:uncharacterized protein LOC128264149 n=1 Tax=Drosophila gunungcola TaxID=103775 RepID=UPI0022E9822A|nr:uncharacterized protein LOC128264149 [Drosophila gunungcola]